MKERNHGISMAKPRIGLYSVGLKAYWSQFEGLKERMQAYGKFIESRMEEMGEVCNFGLVDDNAAGREAGEWFNSKNVDIIFCHSATYVTSDSVLPVHKICKSPAVILNLQPTAQIDYLRTTTGEWLANCGACPVPEKYGRRCGGREYGRLAGSHSCLEGNRRIYPRRRCKTHAAGSEIWLPGRKLHGNAGYVQRFCPVRHDFWATGGNL